jgi:hypothetical protein
VFGDQAANADLAQVVEELAERFGMGVNVVGILVEQSERATGPRSLESNDDPEHLRPPVAVSGRPYAPCRWRDVHRGLQRIR